nr:MAG TPA: hypothetical protein [Caudoviricetes sp.]
MKNNSFLNTPKTGELKPNRHHYRDGCPKPSIHNRRQP